MISHSQPPSLFIDLLYHDVFRLSRTRRNPPLPHYHTTQRWRRLPFSTRDHPMGSLIYRTGIGIGLNGSIEIDTILLRLSLL
jgi:hypothetical protein